MVLWFLWYLHSVRRSQPSHISPEGCWEDNQRVHSLSHSLSHQQLSVHQGVNIYRWNGHHYNDTNANTLLCDIQYKSPLIIGQKKVIRTWNLSFSLQAKQEQRFEAMSSLISSISTVCRSKLFSANIATHPCLLLGRIKQIKSQLSNQAKATVSMSPLNKSIVLSQEAQEQNQPSPAPPHSWPSRRLAQSELSKCVASLWTRRLWWSLRFRRGGRIAFINPQPSHCHLHCCLIPPTPHLGVCYCLRQQFNSRNSSYFQLTPAIYCFEIIVFLCSVRRA